jgi:hypothetical protein
VAITYTPAALARIAYSVYDGVLNKRNPYIIDRKKMPWWSYLMRHEDTAPLAGANGVIVKLKQYGGLDIQGWERRDPLAFAESNIELQTQYPWSNVHMGLEIVHDDLEAMGYVVLPNQARGKNFAKADSKSDAFKMINYLEDQVEDMVDSFDVKMDQTLLRNNTSVDPKLPQGFDAYWPFTATASDLAGNGTTLGSGDVYGYYAAGSIGGKTRSQYEDLQHFVWSKATYGSNGTLRNALTTARREAELRSRGRSKSGIKFIMAGSRFIDKYVAFAQANTIQYHLTPGGTPRLDIGIPDTGLHFEGTPIVHNPSFEIMDQLLGYTGTGSALAWTNRAVLIDDSSVCIAYAPGKKKFFSAPMDEGDVRVTRLSLDSKCVLIPKINNANAIVGVVNT